MTKILELTKQLVSIPSWVDANTNEIKIGEFIFKYLKDNTQLSVKKEMVVNGRFNILASNSQNIETLVVGHIDTVTVTNNWKTNPIKPIIKDGKLFGRGTTDMKSGLAAMMLLASNKDLPSNIGFLFYIDEEYDFAGMIKFIADYGNKISPKNIVSLDGSELEILNGCRGLIEINGTVTGKSCHAGTPENGVNALEITFKSVEKLKKYLAKFNDPELGTTSLNLASIRGGQTANVVPDTCQFILDIRPSSTALSGKLIIAKLQKYLKELNGQLSKYEIKFDFGSWLTPRSKLKNLSLPIKDIRSFGYADLQMLWQIYKQPKCLTIGAGAQKTAHASDEYIMIDKLEKLELVLSNIINKI